MTVALEVMGGTCLGQRPEETHGQLIPTSTVCSLSSKQQPFEGHLVAQPVHRTIQQLIVTPAVESTLCHIRHPYQPQKRPALPRGDYRRASVYPVMLCALSQAPNALYKAVSATMFMPSIQDYGDLLHRVFG
jgi:hypothetical protein